MVSPVAVEILNPNGTILSKYSLFACIIISLYIITKLSVGEPSFDEILTLLKDDNVNVVEVIELLDDVVNTLINNGQTASYKFSNVRSCLYTIVSLLSQLTVL